MDISLFLLCNFLTYPKSSVTLHNKVILCFKIRSSQYSRCIVYGNVGTACNVLDIDEGLTVYEWEKGKDGCLGPTAAWCWGTDSPSLSGTLLLLCPTHRSIDLRLAHLLCISMAQVSTDSSSAQWTQKSDNKHSFVKHEQLGKRKFSTLPMHLWRFHELQTLQGTLWETPLLGNIMFNTMICFVFSVTMCTVLKF